MYYKDIGMNYKISDKPLDNRFSKGRYDHLIELIEDGKTIQDLDQKVCEGIRQACYKKDLKPRIRQQDNDLYSIAIPEKQLG